MLTILLIIIGLCLFEIVSSIDNAVVNAEVLGHMGDKARRWFLLWGVLFAVFVIRGLLPWLILYLVQPKFGIWGALTASFQGSKLVEQSIMLAAPRLLLGGGIFLLFLFLHWLFLEDKNFGLKGERFFQRHGVWFYAVASVLLSIIVWLAVHTDPILVFAAVVGSTGFFVVHGFREQAEKIELQAGANSHMSDISKVIYLMIIDATFSMDGVLGAFAFTLSIPLILIGNGIGAIIVSRLTIKGIDQIKKYPYLKNGAMYAIGLLGLFMTLEGFGYHLPDWLSPLVTLLIVAFFFIKRDKKSETSKKQEERSEKQ